MTVYSDDVDPALVEAAEEVRAYLVALRGGAPFLSGADGRLLVSWLDAGVGVPLILAALDGAAERRRKRPARSRLGLGSCKGEIAKLIGTHPTANLAPSAGPISWVGLAELAHQIAALAVRPGLEDAQQALCEALAALARSPSSAEDIEGVARKAMAACRVYHERAWSSLEAARPTLLAEAAEELAALRDVLSEGALAAAAEELARERLREETPLVSARVVWDRMIGSE